MESALEAKLAGTELKNHQYASPTHEANKLPKMELDEAMMKVKSLPSAVTDAMKMTTLHHRKHHRHHSDNSQFLQQQEEMKKKGIEASLDENKGFRAELAAMVAEAKANIATAKMMISQATTELDTLKTISEEHAYQCSITIAAKQDALRILEEDLAVSMKVENMIDCDDVAPGSTTTLMQCGTGYA